MSRCCSKGLNDQNCQDIGDSDHCSHTQCSGLGPRQSASCSNQHSFLGIDAYTNFISLKCSPCLQWDRQTCPHNLDLLLPSPYWIIMLSIILEGPIADRMCGDKLIFTERGRLTGVHTRVHRVNWQWRCRHAVHWHTVLKLCVYPWHGQIAIAKKGWLAGSPGIPKKRKTWILNMLQLYTPPWNHRHIHEIIYLEVAYTLRQRYVVYSNPCNFNFSWTAWSAFKCK